MTEKEQLDYLDNREKMETWLKLSYIFMKYLSKVENQYTDTDKKREAKGKKLSVLKIITNDWLNYKGRIFENRNLLSSIYSSTKNQDIKENINNFRNLTKQLSELYQKSYITVEDKKQNRIEIKKVIKKKNKIEITLNKQNKNFMDSLKSIEYRNISEHLTKNQLYIDFMRVKDRYFILILGKNEQIGLIDIYQSDTKLIEKYTNDYKKNVERFIEIMNKDEKIKLKFKEKSNNILSNLYDILISKYLYPIIKEKNSLIISPDGLLNFLPFEALYHNGKYLIEDYEISYISSGREFVRQIKREKANPKYEIICFGNPDFNASLPVSELKSLPPQIIEEIPDTWKQYKSFGSIGKAEIEIIRKEFKKSLLIYEDKNATTDNLMNVESSRILHLSTHGKFLNNNDIKNPMLKAGLALSGANDINSSNGIVTALKLSALDLKDTELVVLSACESGLGEVQNAEGVMGLPKAFLQAGAREVIMSLWSVSNQKTAKLMEYFYGNIQSGQNYTTALKNAKIKMIKMHPYYWSAFIIHGIQNQKGK